MKKTISVFFALITALVCAVPAQAISTSAESAILIEAESGEVIYEKDADARRGPASTTKIMTALVAIENCPLEKLVTVAPEAAGVEGSSIYLYAGEKITMGDLLYALMLGSANDAAAAIAYEIAGGIDEFAAMMNEKASSLGLENTHFSNPHGLDAPDHYTTARDLSKIARAALENETFRKIVSSKKAVIPMQSGEATRVLKNHNRLLFLYDDIIGVKTGYTKKCGRTLVSAAERNGARFIAVTLSDGDDWRDHREMLDCGFELYERVTLCRAGELSFGIKAGKGNATVSTARDVCATLKRCRGELRFEADYPDKISENVTAGDAVGEVRFYLDEKLIKTEPLVILSYTEKSDN